MKSLLFILCLIFGVSEEASAQLSPFIVNFGPPRVTSYTGPGDIVASAKFWGGLRAYSSAKRGSAAINVCNVSDVACVDMVTNASTGALVVTTVGGSNCGSVTCTIKIVYDQSGNGTNATQATIASRPILTLNCINTSLPCMHVTGAQKMPITLISTTTSPLSYSAVAERVGTANGFMMTTGADSGPDAILDFPSAATARIYDNGTGLTLAETDNAFHAFQAMANGSSGYIYVDGSSTSGALGPSSTHSTAASLFSNVGGSGNLTGYMAEIGMWPSSFSTGNASSLHSNQSAYWGTP